MRLSWCDEQIMFRPSIWADVDDDKRAGLLEQETWVAVPVPLEFQAIVAELEARVAPTANGVASGGSGHLNGSATDGAASKAATNGSPSVGTG